MKKAYFAISKSNRIHFDEEIEVVRKCMAQKDFELQVFVDQHTFSPEQNKEMMQAAFAAIDECDYTYWSSEKYGDDRILCVTMGTGSPAVILMNESARIQPIRDF